MSSSTAEGSRTATLSVPLRDARPMRLVLTGGATRIRIDANATMDDLFRASFSEHIPTLHLDGSRVEFRFPHSSWWPGSWFAQRETPHGEITLNGRVAWEIAIRGGLSRCNADLRGMHLTGFETVGGASRLELDLPAPKGTVPITVQGGGSRIQLRMPKDTPSAMDVSGGVSQLDFDGQQFRAIGGTTNLRSPGYEAATDRYRIEVWGGASRLSVRSMG